MKAIKLYEQLKKLIDDKVIDKNTEIITNGECNCGINIDKIKIRTKAYLEGSKIKIKPTHVVCLDVNTYLCEPDALGYDNMWVEEDDYYDSIA